MNFDNLTGFKFSVAGKGGWEHVLPRNFNSIYILKIWLVLSALYQEQIKNHSGEGGAEETAASLKHALRYTTLEKCYISATF